jgi:hypothetical protein
MNMVQAASYAEGMAQLEGQFASMLLEDTNPWEGLNLHYIYSAVSVQVFCCVCRVGLTPALESCRLNKASNNIAVVAPLCGGGATASSVVTCKSLDPQLSTHGPGMLESVWCPYRGRVCAAKTKSC